MQMQYTFQYKYNIVQLNYFAELKSRNRSRCLQCLGAYLRKKVTLKKPTSDVFTS